MIDKYKNSLFLSYYFINALPSFVKNVCFNKYIKKYIFCIAFYLNFIDAIAMPLLSSNRRYAQQS